MRPKPLRMTNAQERKAQERQARRRRIQEAARTVFAERGYGGASIELIARAAQLSVGAIYLYFRSKEDLYVSLIEDTLTVFDVEMVQLREQAVLQRRSLGPADCAFRIIQIAEHNRLGRASRLTCG